MTKLLQSLKCACLGGATFMLIAGALFLLSLRGQVQSVGSDLSQALKDTSAAAQSLKETSNQAKANINLVGTQVMQSIANQERTVGKVLLHVDRATGEIAIAARQQRAYWETNAEKTAQILDSGKKAVDQLSTTESEIGVELSKFVDHVDSAVDRLGPAISDIGQTARTATGALEAIDVPAINATLVNIRTATGNMADGSRDVKDYIHRITQPVRGIKAIAKAFVNTAPAAIRLAGAVLTY